MSDPIMKEEKNKLNDTLERLESAKDTLEHSLNTLGSENLEKLKDLRDNPETSGADFHLFLEEIHNKNAAFNLKDKFKRLEELNYLLEEPYFARIDLKNNEDLKKIYIGKFGYSEDSPVITDWRAKVASVYYRYRYPQKNVKYSTPEGEKVRDLKLKRTFEISDSELIKYYNNDIQLDESEIIVDKIEQRTGGVLEDIVETIQESQLDIIESDPRQITIVQGCVGSGKSTVAIHKLSHIFFNYKDLIKPERSILIAKNQILIGYLSTLFPKLGIFDINYKTLRELLVNLKFMEEINVFLDLDLDTDTQRIGEEEIKELKSNISGLHDEVKQKIDAIFKKDEYEIFSGFVYDKKYTPIENIEEAIKDLEEEMSMQKNFIDDSPKSVKALFHKENIKILRKIITRLKKIRIDIKSKMYPKMLKSFGINTKEALGYTEALIFFYTYLEIFGLEKFTKYSYCVIDEGQDFSQLEYSVLSKLVLFRRFCILGDLNQSYANDGISSWEEIQKSIESAENAQIYTLDTNYRSTKQIIDFANNILKPYTNKYLPKSINRIGEEPILVDFNDVTELKEKLNHELNNDIGTLDKSIGIIAFDPYYKELARELISKSKLKKEKFVELEKDTKITYLPKGVYLMDFENCKGLEFSKVYVLGLDLDNVKNFNDAKRAFVTVTRAMNQLRMYNIKI